MDPSFWLQRWRANEIGFHQDKVQPALVKHWTHLNIPKGARVFVPLCGKSHDMTWLESQGLTVIGSELSELAADAYFSERGQTPSVRTAGSFTVKSAGNVEIWCGDFFALKSEHVSATAAYDRAALVAMPPEMQEKYVAKLAELMPAGSQTVLIGLDYKQSEMTGPPFAISCIAVQTLFEDDFNVTLIEAKDGLAKSDHLAKRGVTYLEEATYLLRRRP
jgi:thiopurine S-methyltransferase